MPRVRTLFICTECGGESPRWEGQCPHCSAWNSLVEERVSPPARGERFDRGSLAPARPLSLADIKKSGDRPRWPTGIPDLDFVLGGGIVPGSVVLLGGEPGTGKSTLLLQVSAHLAASGRTVLYVSGEESGSQVKLRAQRLDEPTDHVLILAETAVEGVVDRLADIDPDVLIVDSIQTLYTRRLDSAPGSIAHVREVAAGLQSLAKSREIAMFIVGHVTKDGGLAGPKALEHIVDVVLYLESPTGLDYRIIRATKNRFGTADEIAVFRMSAAGLKSVANPSALFLQSRQHGASGSAVAVALEGSRPVLVEVQALTTRSVYGTPQRVATGFDNRRLALLLAVLERRAGFRASDLDVFLNVVGGLRLTEPAADLAVAAALASAIRDRAIDAGVAFVGELGLGGEIRAVSQLERRLAECGRLDFERVYVSRSSKPTVKTSVEAIAVENIAQLVDELFS